MRLFGSFKTAEMNKFSINSDHRTPWIFLTFLLRINSLKAMRLSGPTSAISCILRTVTFSQITNSISEVSSFVNGVCYGR